MNIMSYFHGVDPAAAVLADGRVVAFVEEERLVRWKHADGLFPIRAIAACLELAGIELRDLDAIVYGWDAPGYADGRIRAFYDRINEEYPPDEGTRAWQRRNLAWFTPERLCRSLHHELRRFFGPPASAVPPLVFQAHHESHAAGAFLLSPFEEALILTVDGSGDTDCTVVAHGKGTTIRRLASIQIPHSLGWLYAAITEYLGFSAYDGEWKVMGLAAYGREDRTLRARLAEVVRPGPQGWDYVVDPRFIHHGAHTYSDRFTDALVELLGLPPRQGNIPLAPEHEDLAFETQRLLEETILRLLSHWRQRTGLSSLCISGGVGLNVKMNSRIRSSGLFERVWASPTPGDSGLAMGAAAACYAHATGRRPDPLEHLYLGPGYTDEQIERQILGCGLPYRRCGDIGDAAAALLARGKVVGWFQGRMEGGPRALGARSILADPRDVSARDRVNAAIKFREYWRPFCPSLTEEAAPRFLKDAVFAPFMIMAFEATEAAKRTVPAVVHVDGTMRAQTVRREHNPRYHRLLEAFERRTGVPVVLNTSFNVKGEAIVCSPRDAFRTFWSTGIDALAIGEFLIEKPVAPEAQKPEDVIR